MPLESTFHKAKQKGTMRKEKGTMRKDSPPNQLYLKFVIRKVKLTHIPKEFFFFKSISLLEYLIAAFQKRDRYTC